MNALLLSVVAISLSSCDYLPTLENEAKKAVASNLIDTESARFENVFTPAGGGVVCGFVNGKNRMGGYAGSKPFIYTADKKHVSIYPGFPTKSDLVSIKFSLSATNGNDAEDKLSELKDTCQFPIDWKNQCKIYFVFKDDGICNAVNKGFYSKEFAKLLAD